MEALLQSYDPVFIGEDRQVDTYFTVPNGRLKLREGRLENALIQYERKDNAGSKAFHVQLYPLLPNNALKQILVNSLGIKAVVDKCRRIYFIDNVKFHFDTVEGLGNFVEVEAIDKDKTIGRQRLQEQCDQYTALFKIAATDFIAVSYSDLLTAKSAKSGE